MKPTKKMFVYLVVIMAVAVCIYLFQASAIAADPKSAVDSGEPAAETKFAAGYQIRSKEFNLLLRPRGASSADGVPIVLYQAYPWECLSWKFGKNPKNDSFRLINLYTHKTFQPDKTGNKPSVSVIQAGINDKDTRLQYWRFYKLPDGLYKIISADGNLALTAEKDNTGEVFIKLNSFENKNSQKWELLNLPENIKIN